MTKDNIKISIFSLLNDEGIKALSDCLKTTFLHMGINVDFEISEKEIYDGSLLITATSTTFNTTPVIFRDVCIVCRGMLRKDDENDTYILDMSCDYNYNLFGGGSNGSEIGVAHFRIFKGMDGKCRAINQRFEFCTEVRRID